MNQVVGGFGLLALLGTLVAIQPFSEGQVETERWFMPGELGYEPGSAPGPLSGRAFLTRAMSGVSRFDDGEWARHNRLTSSLRFSHNLSRVFPASLYEEHPEFFPLENGQRIRPPEGARIWWQPDLGREDVAAYAAEKAREYFDEKPEAVSFALGVNDGLVFGESAETKAWTLPLRWFRGRPDYSNLVFTFMNRVAEELASTHPDKYVGALAYYWAEQVPDFAVHPQVIPFLTADRSQGYDPEFLAEDRALQQKWVAALRAGKEKYEGRRMKDEGGRMTEVGGRTAESGGQLTDREAEDILTQSRKVAESGGRDGASASRQPTGGTLNSELTADRLPLTAGEVPLRLGIYDYLEGTGFLIPRQHPHLLAEHLRYTRRLGYTDYYGEGHPNWGLDGPQPWLIAQLLQDPEQAADTLLDEYYRRYFKEAAEPMRRFYERSEEQWMNQPGDSYWLKFYRNETQAILFPPEVCRELRGYLQEAAALVKTRSVRARVRQVSDAFGVTERYITMQTWRDRLNREVLSGEGDPEQVVRWFGAFRMARTEFVAYTEQIRNRQPLLIAPFKMKDYLKHDPTVNTLVWLRRVSGSLSPELPPSLADDAELSELWSHLAKKGSRIENNGKLVGPLKAPQRIAGLTYGVTLPREWVSKVEPAEHYRDLLLGDEPMRTLRIEGSINTSMFQWRRLDQAEFNQAAIQIRGNLSPSSMALLTLGWLDAKHRRLGGMHIALPTGEWPDWVDLHLGGMIPENAAWVGIGIGVAHQRDGDWVEVKDIQLEVK